MKKGLFFFFLGIVFVAFSVALSGSILSLWLFSGLPLGSNVNFKSFLIANLLVGVVSMILGTIGGFLVGRYWQGVKDLYA